MRERERKRKLNLKKKQEKIEKEKEVRKRMGLPEPGAPYIGPSQVRISQFVRGRRKEETEPVDEQDKEGEIAMSELDEEVLAALASPVSEKSKAVRRPLQDLSGNRSLSHSTQRRVPLKTSSTELEYDWASWLPSNTQVERELSTEDAEDSPPPSTQPRRPLTSHPPIPTAADDTAHLLALISTQDLEDYEDLQASPQLFCADGIEFTEEELLELEASKPATPVRSPLTKQRHREVSAVSAAAEFARVGNYPVTGTAIFDMDEFDLSTQDLRELDGGSL